MSTDFPCQPRATMSTTLLSIFPLGSSSTRSSSEVQTRIGCMVGFVPRCPSIARRACQRSNQAHRRISAGLLRMDGAGVPELQRQRDAAVVRRLQGNAGRGRAPRAFMLALHARLRCMHARAACTRIARVMRLHARKGTPAGTHALTNARTDARVRARRGMLAHTHARGRGRTPTPVLWTGRSMNGCTHAHDL
jgi:hypothetical protein